jgi:hypothetical protein
MAFANYGGFMTLERGHQYKKTDLGISKACFRLSEIIVKGELYMFFNMGEKFGNKTEDDGFVYECRCKCSVIPEGVETNLQPHVFARKGKDGSFTYLGKGKHERRYDEKRNKVFCNLYGLEVL